MFICWASSSWLKDEVCGERFYSYISWICQRDRFTSAFGIETVILLWLWEDCGIVQCQETKEAEVDMNQCPHEIFSDTFRE
jgi:hypothetical protein